MVVRFGSSDVSFELSEYIGRVFRNVLVACSDLSIEMSELISRVFRNVLVACSAFSF